MSTDWTHQLVIQFDDESGTALDGVIEFEDELMELLDGVAEVEGHDAGAGTASIIILTDRPKKLWERLEPIIEEAEGKGLSPVAAAFCEIEDDDYEVLWPSDYDGEFSMS
ncbi:MAG: hypothetical protein ACK5KM_06875 [Hyphomicrobiaceae bacterium]